LKNFSLIKHFHLPSSLVRRASPTTVPHASRTRSVNRVIEGNPKD
jgi:hypothetical protein